MVKKLVLSLLGIALLESQFLLSAKALSSRIYPTTSSVPEDIILSANPISGPIPVMVNAPLSFTASPTYGSAPLEVAFEAALMQNVTYVLDFGEGATSGPLSRAVCKAELCPTPETPLVIALHTYTSAGTYTATLADSSGSHATTTITVTGGF